MPTTNEPAALTQRFVPSEEGLRMALAAAQAGIWEWQLDGQRHTWSDEVWTLFGLGHDVPATYENWLRCIHPDDLPQAQHVVKSAIKAGLPFEAEWRTNPDQGATRWLLVRGQPGASREQGPRTYTGIVMDITERKCAEEALVKLSETLDERVRERTAALGEHERLLQSILDSIPGPVAYWTPDLVNRFANKACCDWFGMTQGQTGRGHAKAWLGDELFSQNHPLMREALAGRPQRFERRIPIPGMPGEYRHTEIHYLPDMLDGVVKGFLSITLDISQIKQAELAAEAANQAKNEFLANISHEVRTPLNAMFGLAQVGARQAAGTQHARTFDQILDSAQHLLALINDVLDFSKIEAGKLHVLLERFNLSQVLDHVLALKSIRAQGKGLKLRLLEGSTMPQYCHGSGTRIAQILLNLLSNAIKFTDEGEVLIRLAYEAPMLVIEVSDTGRGMSPDQVQQLFKPFVQVHGSQTVPEGGSGLGLAICKRLAEMMKGEITVSSTLGQGSTFKVELPLSHPEALDMRPLRQVTVLGLPHDHLIDLAPALRDRGCEVVQADKLPSIEGGDASVLVISADVVDELPMERLQAHVTASHAVVIHSPASTALNLPESLQDKLTVIVGPLSPLRLANAVQAQRHRAPVAVSRRLDGIHVLAAEDNPVNRLVLGQMLEQEGATVAFAFDGAHALEQVRVQGPASFDIVLCDIQMPILDGYQTTEALGRIAPSLPVIGLTAHAFDTAKQQARRVGMVGYITKPYMLDTLVEEIRRYARRRPGELQQDHSFSQPGSPSTTPQPTMQQDITDWQAMQQYFRSQPQLLDRLIDMLTNTLSDIQQQLRQAISSGDMDELAKVAHNIKGTALNLHTPELARLAVQTQERARHLPQEALTVADTLSSKLNEFIGMATHHQSTKAGSTNASRAP